MKLTNFGKSILWKILAFLVYLIPMAALFIWNFEEYTTDSRLSFFGIVIIGFVVIAFANTVKKILNYNVGLSVNAIIFLISIFAQFLGEQLCLISAVSFFGCLISMLFGAVGNTYYRLSFIRDEQGRRRKDMSPGLSFREVVRETIVTFGDPKEEKEEEK